jgi:hypothetical protein
VLQKNIELERAQSLDVLILPAADIAKVAVQAKEDKPTSPAANANPIKEEPTGD